MIRAGTLPTFKALCGTSDHAFYERDPGSHYAQARYLCYYLQEKKLLEPFYQRFVKNAAHDPGGYQTLQELLKGEDMQAFQERWQAYVLKLRFPTR